MDVYAVVGCSNCDALWIVEGRPETTECRRCGTRHQFERLKSFVETEDGDVAREARARLLAARSDSVESLDAVEFGEVDLSEPVVSDEEMLEAAGIDPTTVDTEPESRPTGTTEIVRTAIRDLDRSTRDAIVVYATEHDVPREVADRELSRLQTHGEVTRRDGEYRLV